MTARDRLWLFVLAWLCMVPALVPLLLHLPRFGNHPLPYGDLINALGVAQRHVTNMVSAVNFDYRGLDTLGEECILLGAVTGTTMLLRGARGEDLSARPAFVPGRPILPRSDGTLLICRGFASLILLFGLYIALHAMTTPGGGFQGGVVIATALTLIFFGDGYKTWRRMMSSEVLDAAEGLGATLYALSGFASMLLGGAFLANVLPLGKTGDWMSGGLMLVENTGVALAVAGGFSTLFLEFLEETRDSGPDDEGSKDGDEE